MTDQYIIKNETELREVIGAEVPGLKDKVLGEMDSFAKEFLAKSPFLVLSTSDNTGRIDASPKGDHPGFVEMLDDKTLLVPDRPGNKLAFGHLNILQNPQVGLLFLIPGTPETLRINGKAELSHDPELLQQLAARGKPATLVLKVQIEEVFFHCAKAFMRSNLWQSDTWPERHRVSFGEMFAARAAVAGAEKEGLVNAVDNMVEQDYQENL